MKICLAFFLIFFVCPELGAQTKNRVVEEIIARVNNEIITLSDLQRARESLEGELRQECPTCTPEQLQARIAEKEKDLLRDLVDQSLLVQRGKDMSITVEPEVVKRLDAIRQQNGIASMEDLEKKISESGVSFEDFKSNIRNGLLTQEVIRREVGSKMIIDREEIQKYYDGHKALFQRPEQVNLREIFISTEKKKEDEIPELEKKAQNLLDRLKKGEDFVELAKRFSEGTTAKSGGELGVFGRGELAKDLEEIVFKMNRGQMTEVIRTKTGFLILKVEQRFEAGLQPLDKVEDEVMNRIYSQRMEPALRKYLQTLRGQSYVVVKPGFVDSAAVASTPIQEVEPTPDESKERKGRKRFLLFGKRKTTG